MKRLIFILLAVMCTTVGTVPLQAQTRKIYAVLVTNGKNTPLLIQETTNEGGGLKGFDSKESYLRDSEGNDLKFNNFLTALAYMEKIGWTIPQKEEQILKNISATITGFASFLICKEVSEEEWLQWIERGKLKK